MSAPISPPAPRALPGPVAALLSRLPVYPGSALLATALNLVLRRHLPDDVLALLRQRPLRILVRDAGLAFDVAWSGQRFVPGTPGGLADLTLSASAHDFVLLAQRQQDPDTLFFGRRLSMEGDTELGLVLKNALDAIELPVLDLPAWLPGALRGPWAARRSSRHGQP